MAAKPTQAVAYIRSATHTPTASKHSTASQARRIQHYCSDHRIKLVSSFVEYGMAGGTVERTGLRGALAALTGGQADLLIVANACRLTRSVTEMAKLVSIYFGDGAYGLVSLDERLDTRTANGRFVLGLLQVIGRWESEVIYHA